MTRSQRFRGGAPLVSRLVVLCDPAACTFVSKGNVVVSAAAGAGASCGMRPEVMMEPLEPVRSWPPSGSWAVALLATPVAGCVAVPVPASKESVVDGRAIVEDDVRAMLAGGEGPAGVMARLGRPAVNFGPQGVLVYLWTVNKGVIPWV